MYCKYLASCRSDINIDTINKKLSKSSYVVIRSNRLLVHR